MPSMRGTARVLCPSSLLTPDQSKDPTFGSVEGVGLVVVGSTGRRRKQQKLTFKNSFVASCHSLVMVLGGGLANDRTVAKRRRLAPTPMAV